MLLFPFRTKMDLGIVKKSKVVDEVSALQLLNHK